MNRTIRLAAFAAFGFLAFDGVVKAQEPSPLFAGVTEFEYPSDGAVLGQGWNAFAERGTAASCVKIQEVPIGTSSFSADFEEVKSSYSLLKKQSISAKVAGSYGGVSGSASASSSGSRKINTEFVNVLFTLNSNIAGTKAIGVPVGNEADSSEIIRLISREDFVSLPESSQVALIETHSGTTTQAQPQIKEGSNIELTAYALGLLEAGRHGQFLSSCGSGFVSAIQRGTSVSILATYRSRKLSEQSAFKASLSANGYGASGSVSASSSSELDTFKGETTFKIFQTGGVPVGIPASFSGVREELSDLNKFISNPSPYSIVVTPYTALPGFNLQNSIPQPDALVRMANYHIALSDLFRVLEGVLEEDLAVLNPTANTANYDRKILDAYGGIEAVTDLKDTVLADLQLIEQGISACLDDARKCQENTIVDKYIAEIQADISTSKAERQAVLDLLAQSQPPAEEPTVQPMEPASRIEPILAARVDARNLRQIAERHGIVFDRDPADSDTAAVERAQQEVAYELRERIEFFNRSIASKENEIKNLESNRGNFPPEFFLEFYDYLLLTPLSKELLSSNNSTSAQVDVERMIRKAIFQGRLHPWRNFYCGNGFNDFMCVSEGFLNEKFDESKALEALRESITATNNVVRCQPAYAVELTRIDKSRHRNHHKDRQRMRSEARAQYCRNVVVDMTL